jgi:hypothetical protein
MFQARLKPGPIRQAEADLNVVAHRPAGLSRQLPHFTVKVVTARQPAGDFRKVLYTLAAPSDGCC